VRDTNGYRQFNEAQVAEILLVANETRRGKSIGDLIRDGQPVLPVEPITEDQTAKLIAQLRAQIADCVEILQQPVHVYLSEEGRLMRRAVLERIKQDRIERAKGRKP
jgi:hypothetical protein